MPLCHKEDAQILTDIGLTTGKPTIEPSEKPQVTPTETIASVGSQTSQANTQST